MCWQNGHIDVLRPRVVTEYQSMWGQTVIPFFIDGPNLDLDYPAVEDALKNGIGHESNISRDKDRERRHSV